MTAGLESRHLPHRQQNDYRTIVNGARDGGLCRLHQRSMGNGQQPWLLSLPPTTPKLLGRQVALDQPPAWDPSY